MGFENSPQDASPEERRKSSKPMMEKRRRARINQSLNELKALILEAMKKDTSCYSKLEKADILEMTVRHLRTLRSQKSGCSMTPDSGAVAKYRAGFNECASEISRFLITLDGIDVQLRARLLSHVASCCNAVKAVTHSGERSMQQQPLTLLASPSLTLPTLPSAMLTAKPAESVTASMASGMLSGNAQYQIVPGTLANGKIAAVIVPSQNPVAVVSAPQFIPVFNKPTVDFQPLHGFQISNNPLRQETESLWRPW